MPRGKRRSRLAAAPSKRRGFLEHLFGSRTRVKLLRLFLRNSGRPFYVRELSREVGAQIHAVRRELDRFVLVKLLRAGTTGDDPSFPRKKFYVMDEGVPLYSELKSLVIKAQVFAEEDMVLKLQEAGKMAVIFFCGAFVGDPGVATDLLLVGRIDRGRLRAIMERYGKEAGFDIRYTVMTPAEFKYRRDVADRFLLSILDGRHILGYNNLPELPLSVLGNNHSRYTPVV